MKNLLFALLFAVTSQAAYVTIDATFTNRSLIGSNFVISGTTVTYTNAPLNSTTWIVTNSAAQSATNLQRFLGANYPKLYARMTNATNVTISGTDLQFSFPGNGAAHFAYTTTNSAPTTNFHAILVPWDTQPFATNRTNDADELIYGLNKYAKTNAFATNAQALTNYLSLGPQSQTFSNKTALNTTNVNGTFTNSTITNATRINANLALFTNATILSGALSNAAVLNATAIGGVVAALTNGYSTNLALDSPRLTNAAGTLLEPIAYVGNVGNGLILTNSRAEAVSMTFDVTNAVLGAGIYFNIGGTNIWFAGIDGYDFVMAGNGTNFISMIGGRVLVGNAGVITTFGDYIFGLQSSNAVFKGTNTINGRVDFTSRANASLANGNNSGIVLGSNVYVQLSGPTGAYTNAGFAAEMNGSYHILEFDNPVNNMTILDNSGLDPSAANRIRTTTGGALNFTNNPVVYRDEVMAAGVIVGDVLDIPAAAYAKLFARFRGDAVPVFEQKIAAAVDRFQANCPTCKQTP